MTIDDKDLKRLFEECRTEVADDGFSQDVKKQLLTHPSFLHSILMSICISIGIAFFIMIQGIETFIGNLSEFVSAISQSQQPSAASIVTYLGLLFCACIIGYTLTTTD
jgi:hypothetical protein